MPRAQHEERASNYLFQLCRLVLLTEFPGRRLDDVRWVYQNGFFTSHIRFCSLSHGVTLMRLSSTYGLTAGGAHLVDYESGYYDISGASYPPSSPASCYVMWSAQTGRTVYLSRENGPRVQGYALSFVEPAAYAQTIRRHQPLVFQTVPDQMQAVDESGDGSRPSQALAMSKVFCRRNYQTGADEAGIFSNPRASLGLLGHCFAALPVLARAGMEESALAGLCGFALFMWGYRIGWRDRAGLEPRDIADIPSDLESRARRLQ